MYFISKIKSFLLFIIKIIKVMIFGKNQIKSSKYDWEKIEEGLFIGKELMLPKEWGYKVIDCLHESEIFDTIKRLSLDNEVMYDIGAHYGWFSVAWICSGGKYVEAFEPAKKNADIMMETILKNRFENHIKLHRIALSGKTQEEDLYLFNNDSSRNFINRSNEINNSQNFSIERVQTFQLDDYKNKLKKPDLIKIDVEGLEMEVLKGSKNLIIETDPSIVVEIHDLTNALEVANYLGSLGYAMEILGYKGRNKSLPLVLWTK